MSLNLPFDIAITGLKAGLDAAAGARTAGGARDMAGGGNDTAPGAFAGLMALLAQAVTAGNPGTQSQKTPGSDIGNPGQSAANWLQAQLGELGISLDGKSLSGKELLAQLGEVSFNLDGKSLNAGELLAQLVGGSENLNILGGAAASVDALVQSKVLQSSQAYQAVSQARAGVSQAMEALPAANAARAVAQQAAGSVFADAENTPPPRPGGAVMAPLASTQELSSSQLSQLALLSQPAAGGKPEASAQTQNPASLIGALLANNKGAKGAKAASGTGPAAPAASQAGQADTLAAQLQSLLSAGGENKTNTQAKASNTVSAEQNTKLAKSGPVTLNPAQTPFQLLQAKVLQAKAATAGAANANAVAAAADVQADADIVQGSASVTQPGAAKDLISALRPAQSAYQGGQINLANVAFAIARNFNAGNNRFQIRLDPPELGRINVRLDVDKKGGVNARLSVERADTLDLLQRDVRVLERALAQAGLDSSRTNLEFSLKQNPFTGGGFNGENDNQQQPATTKAGDAEATIPPEQASNAYRGSLTPGGVSLWV